MGLSGGEVLHGDCFAWRLFRAEVVSRGEHGGHGGIFFLIITLVMLLITPWPLRAPCEINPGIEVASIHSREKIFKQ